jgi:hypothetical protein
VKVTLEDYDGLVLKEYPSFVEALKENPTAFPSSSVGNTTIYLIANTNLLVKVDRND